MSLNLADNIIARQIFLNDSLDNETQSWCHLARFVPYSFERMYPISFLKDFFHCL